MNLKLYKNQLNVANKHLIIFILSVDITSDLFPRNNNPILTKSRYFYMRLYDLRYKGRAHKYIVNLKECNKKVYSAVIA